MKDNDALILEKLYNSIYLKESINNIDSEYLEIYKIYLKTGDDSNSYTSKLPPKEMNLAKQKHIECFKKLQSIIDKKAHESGYTIKAYKGWNPFQFGKNKQIRTIKNPNPFTPYDVDLEYHGICGFFSDDEWVAYNFKGRGFVDSFYLKTGNQFVIDLEKNPAGAVQFEKSDMRFHNAVRSGKYDSILLKNTADEGNVYVQLNPNTIKLTNYKTFDLNKEIILPSKRFDETSDDIHF
jgi:hypothetical protein